MENKKIRVNTGITIEVNDNGDTIVVRVDDSNFVDAFYDLLEMMEQKEKEIAASKYENDREKLSFVKEKMKEIVRQIDQLFGQDTCKKVFGDIIPSGYAVADFFEQLVPIISEYSDARQKKIAEKYNRSRKGSKTTGKPYYQHGKGKKR